MVSLCHNVRSCSAAAAPDRVQPEISTPTSSLFQSRDEPEGAGTWVGPGLVLAPIAPVIYTAQSSSQRWYPERPDTESPNAVLGCGSYISELDTIEPEDGMDPVPNIQKAQRKMK